MRMSINRMILILAAVSIVATVLIWYAMGTTSPGNLQETERKAFLVFYQAEKKDETSIDEGNVKLFSILYTKNKETRTGFYENEAVAWEIAEKRVKELFPEEDGWINHKVEIIPQPPQPTEQ